MPTLKDIAKKLNLSVTAVSRALLNMPDISPSTSKLVHETAINMGYKKNLSASYLRTSRSMIFGIVVPDICNPVFSYIHKGIETICNKKHYTLMLGNSNKDSVQEAKIIENMISHGVDGLFIIPSTNKISQHAQLEKSNTPFIVLQRKIDLPCVNFIQTNDYMGGYFIAEHLYSLGHRKFLLAFANIKNPSAHERYKGFLSYLNTVNLDESSIEILENCTTRDEGYNSICQWLKNQPDISNLSVSSIFCFSDYVAYGVYSALLEFNINVPNDISIVGYDNNEYSNILHPPLTTMDILPYDLGRHSAEIMFELIKNPKSNEKITFSLPPKLIVRNSTKAIN